MTSFPVRNHIFLDFPAASNNVEEKTKGEGERHDWSAGSMFSQLLRTWKTCLLWCVYIMCFKKRTFTFAVTAMTLHCWKKPSANFLHCCRSFAFLDQDAPCQCCISSCHLLLDLPLNLFPFLTCHAVHLTVNNNIVLHERHVSSPLSFCFCHDFQDIVYFCFVSYLYVYFIYIFSQFFSGLLPSYWLKGRK